jgi:hypothetical protein
MSLAVSGSDFLVPSPAQRLLTPRPRACSATARTPQAAPSCPAYRLKQSAYFADEVEQAADAASGSVVQVAPEPDEAAGFVLVEDKGARDS